ncbi:ubiquitin-conjugating enzyme/RWD-like protein, partial [Syncephalastrum racemosum]
SISRTKIKTGDLDRDPPPGITCYPVEDDITQLEAFIKGPPDSPYEKGMFQLEIRVPYNYPMEPPQIRFKTPIYHPNIDDNGRICADILKAGGSGTWGPALNLSTTLILLSTLMASPNPDDPLVKEIAHEFSIDHARYVANARAHTEKYAMGTSASAAAKVCPETISFSLY